MLIRTRLVWWAWPSAGALALAATAALALVPRADRADVPPVHVAPVVLAAPRCTADEPPPQVLRAPVAADLARYTRGLSGSGSLVATISTSLGTLHCTLFPEVAPVAVASFVGLATGQQAWRDPRTGELRRGRFYDGLVFHRVIPGFVIQGGDPRGDGTGGPGYTFADELAPQLPLVPGTLAMANAGPNSNGSQFFIAEGTPSYLIGRQTVFGRCAELDVVRRVARVARDHRDHPIRPVVIERVTIARAR
ncbi:MAG TPA: peptidylprolyl isomerase [Kofleriaceae bacterium]|nr:peptidylprolyl isomerase [Kofleriaceae bacterium]